MLEGLDKGIIESKLKGNTLRVYVFALRRRRVGVREVQRGLSMSNPSLAQYHLNKLVEMGLLKENNGEYEVSSEVPAGFLEGENPSEHLLLLHFYFNGEYEVSSEVKVDVLKDFLLLGNLLVPRFVFYAAFFSVFSAYFLYLSSALIKVQPLFLAPTSLLLVATLIFWYEALHAWRNAPAS